jgi:hypothetical protein
MKKHIWSGIIIWGILVTCFGLGLMNPTSIVSNSSAYAAPDQEMVFLLSGGIVTCLIGLIGLISCMRWIRGCNQQSGAAVHYAMF